MPPAKIDAAATTTNVTVGNMKPIIRAIPRISRSKPSIAPVGERARRRDEPELQRFKARIYETLCRLPDAAGFRSKPNPSFTCHARVRRIYDGRLFAPETRTPLARSARW